MKIREYAACGLPIVCDPSTGTAEEAAETGAAILVKDKTSLADALNRLMSDDVLYGRMSEAALVWAKANDKRLYLENLMDTIGDIRKGSAADRGE